MLQPKQIKNRCCSATQARLLMRSGGRRSVTGTLEEQWLSMNHRVLDLVSPALYYTHSCTHARTHARTHAPPTQRWTLTSYRHVTRHSSLRKTNLLGTLEGTRRCGHQRNCWVDNVLKLTALTNTQPHTSVTVYSQLLIYTPN